MIVRKDQLSRFFKAIKPWYLLVLTVLVAAICIYALRANNEHMSQLRNDIYTADKNGGNVDAALETLAKYVTSNMNTSLSSGPNSVYPPIQLTYSYNRDTSNESLNLQQQNSALYTEAENYCQAAIPQGFSGRYRIPCIEQYVTSHGLSQANVPSSLYEFDFVSPYWSPDLAGWMLIATVLLAIATIINYLYHWRIKKSHQNWQPKI